MRSIDHLVMPFGTLAAARGWFERLGFLVAPDAIHPFGTGNACVFFADGRYLEPLAVADFALYERSRDEGHLFVERDAAARHADAPPAISGIAFRSSDALADREQLLEEEAGDEGLVEFGRTMRLPDGGSTELSFRLAFAAIHAADAPSFFYCEARHQAKPDRSALTPHPNGVTGIAGVTLQARDPRQFSDYLAAVANGTVEARDDGSLTIPLDGGRLDLQPGGEAEALRIDSMTLRVADLASARNLWQTQGITFEEMHGAVTVSCPNGAGRIRFIEDRS